MTDILVIMRFIIKGLYCISYPSVKTCVMGAQKNNLLENPQHMLS